METQYKRSRAEALEEGILLKEAAAVVATYITEHYKDGTTILHDWFKDRMPVEPPSVRNGLTLEDAAELYNKEKNQYDIAYMKFIVKVVKLTALNYQRLLVNVRNEGYRIARPDEVRSIAAEDMLQGIYSKFEKALFRMRNTMLSDLSPEDAEKHEEVHAAIKDLMSTVTYKVKQGDFIIAMFEDKEQVSHLH